SEIQADYRHDSACDNRWHPLIDPVSRPSGSGIHPPDQKTDKCINQASGNDGPQSNAYIGIVARTRITGNGNYPADKSKALLHVTSQALAHEYKKHQCTYTRHEAGHYSVQ